VIAVRFETHVWIPMIPEEVLMHRIVLEVLGAMV
jgi:hypothetical protein